MTHPKKQRQMFVVTKKYMNFPFFPHIQTSVCDAYLYYHESPSGATAVREVLEETGVRSEFRSLLSIRQQHNHPGAFGMSDMYIICRLSPLTYDINFCTQECLRCEWLDLAELARTDDTTPITSRLARLLLHGLERGFHEIDLSVEELPAVYSGMFYQLYHRQLPAALKS